MSPELIQIIQEKLETLPVAFRKALMSVDMPAILSKISTSYGLHVDQAGALETEVMIAILGIEEQKDLPSNLKRELNIDTSRAQKISQDVEEFIFRGIRRKMMEFSSETQPQYPASQDNTKNNENETIDRAAILKEIELLGANENRVLAPNTNVSRNMIEKKTFTPTVAHKEVVDLNQSDSTKFHREGRIDPYREPI